MDFNEDDFFKELKWKEKSDPIRSCTIRQEKSQKMLRLGVSLISISVAVVISAIALMIFTTNEKTKAWFKENLHLQNKKRGRSLGPTVITSQILWWSPSKHFALALLPDIHILNFSEPNPGAITTWKLGCSAELLGSTPSLHFLSSGILELKSTAGYTVWTSESLRPRVSPLEQKQKDLEYFQGIQHVLELTDEGQLQIIALSKFQPDIERQITWQSNTVQEETSEGCQIIRVGHLFHTGRPLYSSNEMCQLIFNDVTGILQVWMRETSSNRTKVIWQSENFVIGEQPWVCLMTGVGILVILDCHRTVIWSSSFLNAESQTCHRTLSIENLLPTPQMPFSGQNVPLFLSLSNDGQIQLAEKFQGTPYWHSADLHSPDWLTDGHRGTDGKPGEHKTFRHEYPEIWYFNEGYKRTLHRLCLIGNDSLVSHQKLWSLTDACSLELLPTSISPREIKSMIWLDETKASVFYILFMHPVSIFADNLLNGTAEYVSLKMLSNESIIIKETDRPLILYFRKKTLCLTTVQGTLIAKKNINLLSSQLTIKTIS